MLRTTATTIALLASAADVIVIQRQPVDDRGRTDAELAANPANKDNSSIRPLQLSHDPLNRSSGRPAGQANNSELMTAASPSIGRRMNGSLEVEPVAAAGGHSSFIAAREREKSFANA